MTLARLGSLPAVLLALALAAFLAVSGAGCSSETPNLVGTGLVNASIDTVLQLLTVTEITDYRAGEFDEPEAPFPERQALFMGRRAGERSAMLFNYDFSTLADLGWTPDLVTVDNLKDEQVWISLLMLTPYFTADEDTTATGGSVDLLKSYVVRQLVEPFDPENFPGPIPPTVPGVVNSVTEAIAAGGRVLLRFPKARFVNWFNEGVTVGLLIEEGDHFESQEGFVGYAARDLTEFDLIALTDSATTVAATVHAEFTEGVGDTNFFINLAPTEDVSTLDVLDSTPSALDSGMMVRTHARSYPLLLFDLSPLPANVQINRARLLVAVDSTRSYGPNAAGLVVGELDPALLPDPVNALDLDVLGINVYQISGQNSLIPEQTGPLAFNVTQSVQRHINSVYEGTRGFVLYGGETFSSYRQSLRTTPRTFLQRFWFYGNDAPADSLRPQLRITYTRNDSITGVGP